MIIILSPSKTLDFKPQKIIQDFTTPDFLKRSEKLIKELRKYKQAELSELMTVSPAIAQLNADRYASWNLPFTESNAKQCILAFKGNVYLGLNAETFSRYDFSFAQKHLRILSGLYGVLRPLDLIQPYRLEMGTKLNISKSSNLYQFWGDLLTQCLNDTFTNDSSCPVLLNLASAEYFKGINRKLLKADLITAEFREYKNGKYDVISIYAKKARGLMSRFIIKNKLTSVDDIKGFDDDGYIYNCSMSSEKTWVFTRR